jgi:hypothetical protein
MPSLVWRPARLCGRAVEDVDGRHHRLSPEDSQLIVSCLRRVVWLCRSTTSFCCGLYGAE